MVPTLREFQNAQRVLNFPDVATEVPLKLQISFFFIQVSIGFFLLLKEQFLEVLWFSIFSHNPEIPKILKTAYTSDFSSYSNSKSLETTILISFTDVSTERLTLKEGASKTPGNLIFTSET